MAVTAATSPLRVIGEYEVVQRLAHSDLSSIYKARHPATGRVVAAKVPGPEVVGNPVLLKRFEQEFTVASSLRHPHLVRALQFGRDGETPYILMEFVDGPSLGDRIEQDGRLPEAEAVRILTQVAEALHYAHQHRVIHRDVKPDNILLAPDGSAKLTDLGLAKDFEADMHLTRASAGLGTPNFIAPEQFNDAKHADPRCDVYALGATLYMALTGVLPFRARGVMGVLKKKLDNDLVRPRQLVSVMSPWIESTICRSMDVNPRVRPASCLEFIEELKGCAASPPAAAKASPAARPTVSLGRRDQDRRAAVRYASGKEGPCQALCSEKQVRWVAEVRDVSADGIGLVMNRRVEPRTILTLEFPATDQEGARRLLIRVVRVQALSKRRWLLGCVFARRLGEDEVQTMI
jgi:serine/threonine protein kinase